MSIIVGCMQTAKLSKTAIQTIQSKCIHVSSLTQAAKEYDEIKLRPFVEGPVRGYDKWRRRNHLPHHVENVKFRQENDLPPYYNLSGPLTDNPDYSYVDETLKRPPTYGVGQRKRMIEQVELTKTIVKCIGELDHGKKKYQDKLRAVEEEKQAIINSKLKPKGTETL